MIQSIQAGSTAIYNQTRNMLGAGKVSTGTSVDEEQTASAAVQNEDETTVTSVQGDTLTISKAGAQQAKTFTAQSAETPEYTYTNAKAEAISSAASSVGITDYTAVQNENSANSAAVSSGSSSSSSSDSDLSQYSESELKEMLQNGEITQAEYNAEIKSRQETSTASDEQSEAFSVENANEAEA